jgi:hypothetical protein
MLESVSTDTELCNLALSHIAGSPITAMDENSPEAEACRTFYGTALAYVLGDHDWKFASTKKVGVQIVVPSVTPEIIEADLDGWQYMYAYPSDCVKVREVLTANQYQNSDPFGFGNSAGAAYGPEDVASGISHMTSNSYTLSRELGFGDQRGREIPFNVAAIETTRYIFTDVPNARFRFTRYLGNVVAYPPDFALLFSFYLASLMAYRITRRLELTSAMLKLYQTNKPEIQATNLNEATNINRDPPPAWVITREGF